MKYKVLTGILSAAIVLSACTMLPGGSTSSQINTESTFEENRKDSAETTSEDSDLTTPEEVISPDYDTSIRPQGSLSDYILRESPLPTVYLDDPTLSLIYEKFGEIIINHLVLFDFFGEGEYSIVIFGSYQEATEDSFDAMKNAAVFALINGEPHRVVLGFGEVMPTAVVPVTFWDGEGSDFDNRPALLLVDRDIVGNDWASLVIFDGNHLQIQRLRPEIE